MPLKLGLSIKTLIEEFAMNTLENLLTLAAKRAADKSLPYAGELKPQEAFDALQHEGFILVDVRSQAELDLVGRVPNAHHIEWAFYPGMVPNPEFATQLSDFDKANKIIFMCRTGGRSHNAAVVASQFGYTAYNMAEGFEGEANAQKQRTLINGWKFAKLPWTN
jgi:rhodanese-related sulfurtransferase